jgi:hypothetical protein
MKQQTNISGTVSAISWIVILLGFITGIIIGFFIPASKGSNEYNIALFAYIVGSSLGIGLILWVFSRLILALELINDSLERMIEPRDS